MSDDTISLEIEGLLETQRKLDQVVRDLRGDEFLQGMRDATMLVTRDARILAPVDMGPLRASITPEVVTQGREVQGIVGSNKRYAAAQELGTRPFWPPLAALEVWARRHGTTAYLVARGIAAHGIRPKRFLQQAFEQNLTAIQRLVEGAVSRIVSK